MAHTITALNGAGVTTPLAVSEPSSDMESRTIYHDTLDGGVGQSWIPPRPRSGTLTLTYTAEADANAARLLFAAAPRFSWVTTDVSTLSMTFGVDSSISTNLDASTGVWTVSVGFQELPA